MTMDPSVREARASLVRAAGMIELTERYGVNRTLRRPAYVSPVEVQRIEPAREWSGDDSGKPFSWIYFYGENAIEVAESALEVLTLIAAFRGMDA